MKGFPKLPLFFSWLSSTLWPGYSAAPQTPQQTDVTFRMGNCRVYSRNNLAFYSLLLLKCCTKLRLKTWDWQKSTKMLINYHIYVVADNDSQIMLLAIR